MKILLIVTALLFSFGFSNLIAQTVNNVPLKDIDVDYMQIVGTSKYMSNKVTIEIDFGQENKYFNTQDARINDENGKPVVFNSMIDALNFFSKNGYEFVDAYIISIGNQNVYHYMLRKKKS